VKTVKRVGMQSRFVLAVACVMSLGVGADSAVAQDSSQRVELTFVKPAGAEDALPVATTEADDGDHARKTKSARYDRVLPKPIKVAGASERHELNTRWWNGLASLPVAQSDRIVLGQVVNARAHLTPSGTGLYSEFTIRVLESIHGPGTAQELIKVLRVGGAVLHTDGTATTFRVAYQGMPAIGNRYVLFLRNADTDLEIVTGYDVTSGKVVPLDGKGGTLVFARHATAEVNAFLAEVRTAVGARGGK
jgi:hypothetical protein